MPPEKSTWLSITNLLVTIAIAVAGWGWTSTQAQIGKLDDKLFKHLTNSDMHIIRGTVVEKAVYEANQQLYTAQLNSMMQFMLDIKTMLKEHETETKANNEMAVKAIKAR